MAEAVGEAVAAPEEAEVLHEASLARYPEENHLPRKEPT